MRILQISSSESFGGGEKHFCDLVAGLSERGNTVFAAVRPGCGWKDRLEGLSSDCIYEVSLRGSADMLAAFRLSRLIRQLKPDIVHAHMARDYAPAAFAARIAGRSRLVLTRHVLFPMSQINRYLLRNAARVIAVSSGVEPNLRRIFPENKIVSIPNGIGMERFGRLEAANSDSQFRENYGIPSDARIVATVGELKPLKGQEEFVLAAAEIAKEDPHAYFMSVGKDSSAQGQFKRRLRRLVSVFGLEDRFIFLDWLDDTAPLLRAAEVFVSASHSESFGLAILEAMASSKPVVATSTAGACELIEDGRSGILVDPKDPVAIARAVKSVLGDVQLSKRLGAEAHKRAVSGFSLEKMVSATEELYSELIAVQSPKAPDIN